MSPRLALVGWALLCSGCALFSSATFTTVDCPACIGDGVVQVGAPFTITFEWPCTKGEQGECLPWNAEVECQGIPCVTSTSGSNGSGSATITPSAPGAFNIALRYGDWSGKGTSKYDGMLAVAPQRIVFECGARRPGEAAWRDCAEGLRAGDDVRLDVLLEGDGRRLSGKPPSVVMTGVAEKAWRCQPPLNPSVALRCVTYGLPAGEHAAKATLDALEATWRGSTKSRLQL
jgi:hypothetical protein